MPRDGYHDVPPRSSFRDEGFVPLPRRWTSLSCHPLCKLPSNEESSFTPDHTAGGRGSHTSWRATVGGKRSGHHRTTWKCSSFRAPRAISWGCCWCPNAKVASAMPTLLPATGVALGTAPCKFPVGKRASQSMLGPIFPFPSNLNRSPWLPRPLEFSPTFSERRRLRRPDFSLFPTHATIISASVSFLSPPTWGIFTLNINC